MRQDVRHHNHGHRLATLVQRHLRHTREQEQTQSTQAQR
jgi:hypothetical protein